jgi:hypothetical protein
MQSSDHGSPSSSLPASIPNDIVLRPNATAEEKLQLLALLVPKAENAKNRVADLHAKTAANVDKCLKFAAQIKEVHNYAQLFFTQMNPQLMVRACTRRIEIRNSRRRSTGHTGPQSACLDHSISTCGGLEDAFRIMCSWIILFEERKLTIECPMCLVPTDCSSASVVPISVPTKDYTPTASTYRRENQA